MTLKELGNFVQEYNSLDDENHENVCLVAEIQDTRGIRLKLLNGKEIKQAIYILDYEQLEKMPCSLLQKLIIDELEKRLKELN